MKRLIAFCIVIPILFFFQCKKDFSRQPTVTTGTFELANAIAHGTLVDLGTKEVTDHGFCWDSIGSPSIASQSVRLGSLGSTGSFQAQLTTLRANKTYSLKAFISYGEEVFYGATVTFTTPDLPELITAAVSDVTESYAKCGGEITADNGSPVLSRGVCWGIATSPDTTGSHTSDGTGTGVFQSVRSGLIANTQYFVRAYATTIYGTRYGNEVIFNTGQSATAPLVATTPVTGITQSTASSGGNVVSDGGSTVVQRGVCWSTSPNPTTVNAHTTDGSGLGNFVSSITGLTANTKYYVRAYATSSAGTAYGNEISFTAGQLNTSPTVITSETGNITQTTATSGGEVTSDGGEPVTARGVCWSTSPNPTLANNYTNDGSGTGTFLSSITGLTPNTTYYVRAYATNAVGTSYGNEKSFTTLKEVTPPSVTTAPITNITTTTATSGGTVTDDGGAAVTARGVCWSTSSNPTTSNTHTTNGTGTGSFVSQLTGLTSNTLYYVRAYATNSAGTAYGNQLTFTTLQDPVLPTVTTDAASNIAQTTATGGGNVLSDGGSPVTARGVCWNTYPNPTLANNYTNNGSGTGAFISYLTGLTPNTLYYVRAYATNSVGTAYGNEITFTTLPATTIPTVTTDNASNITQTTATSGGNVTSSGGATVTARGVCWNTSPNPTLANNYTTNGSGTGTFVSNLTGLTPSTLYYVRAYATNSVGTAYGNEISFTTLANGPCPGIPTILYEGKLYNTIQIGTQCWFRENLNVGTRINGSQNQTNNSIKEKYCYEDLESNCDVYGGLYQWDEMMQYVNTQGTQGICPTEWHIPTDEELTALSNLLGGASIAGGKLKESGYTHWAPPNTGATNSSGFTGLPGGYRHTNGNFGNLSGNGYFWSSSQIDGTYAWCMVLNYDNEEAYRYSGIKTYGFSIRCIKD